MRRLLKWRANIVDNMHTLNFASKKTLKHQVAQTKMSCRPWRGILLTFLKQNINSTNSKGSSSYTLKGARTHARDCGDYTSCFNNHVLEDISRFLRNSENMKQENEWWSSTECTHGLIYFTPWHETRPRPLQLCTTIQSYTPCNQKTMQQQWN